MKNHLTHTFETSVGKLEYYDLGTGPAVVLLHGFPDSPTTFSYLVDALIDNGYRCIVPFMPGYGQSSLPFNNQGLLKGPEASMLGIGKMLNEFLGIHLAGESLQLVGHDWGSMVAQMLVALNDDKPHANYQIDSAVFYAVPPIAAFAKNIGFKQLYRSRYMAYFQGFGVAKKIRSKNLAYISELWLRWSPWNPEELAQQAQLKKTLQTLKTGQCLENGMAYYRCLLNPFYILRSSSLFQQVSLLFKKRNVPCLLLTGEKDACIGADMFNGSEECYPNPGTRLEVMKNLGHFAHLENPEKVNAIITDFLRLNKPQKQHFRASH
ncbi:MAG: alpha/beta hydrolase [Pseudomonadales bacterium]|nr:alpha/beta hydrolase [Pseudomonadales bacterium]